MRLWMPVAGLAAACAICASVVALDSGGAASPPPTTLELVAHRGVHHDFPRDDLQWDTCTAARIYPPAHTFIENTRASIEAAFELGATVVELDIRPTRDGHFVVFHDFGLDCRTDGHGLVRDHDLADLRGLDLGYGYTADGGLTSPLRGAGVGMLMTLPEVLSAMPERSFLIDFKDGDDLELAQRLVEVLTPVPTAQRQRLKLWVGDAGFALIHAALPEVERLFLGRAAHKRIAARYVTSLGLVGIGSELKGQGLGAPAGHLRYLWGWPDRFLRKVHRVGARFYVLADTEQELELIADAPVDGIITDHIEIIGPLLGQQGDAPGARAPSR